MAAHVITRGGVRPGRMRTAIGDMKRDVERAASGTDGAKAGMDMMGVREGCVMKEYCIEENVRQEGSGNGIVLRREKGKHVIYMTR